MKIVLVYPGITSLGFDSFGIGAEGSWINHGLCLLSACARQEGHSVYLVDLRRLSGWDEYKRKIAEHKPALVAVTMMSVDYEPAVKCVRLAKEVDPGIVTIAGGPHPSIMPEELVEIKELDYIMKGEGEISFIRLLDALARGHAPAERVLTGEMPDLDRIPYSDRDLFNAQEQPWWLTEKTPFVTIIAGRGCIYNCNYCQPAERHIFGRTVRRRSVENVVGELKMLRDRYQFKSFMFHDDCLIENPAWVREFCRRYREEGFTQEFICQGRADLICRHRDLIKEMRAAGLIGIIIGFESGNQRVLNFIRKGATVEQNYEAAAVCKELGIRIQANFMLGIPTETNEEMMDTFRMIEKINPEFLGRSIYTPAPGSDLFEYCKKNNLTRIVSHDDYRRDPYRPNKLWGIDYGFIERESRRLDRKRLPFVKMLAGECIWYFTRKNRVTLSLIKRLVKVPFIRAAAHALVRKSSA